MQCYVLHTHRTTYIQKIGKSEFHIENCKLNGAVEGRKTKRQRDKKWLNAKWRLFMIPHAKRTYNNERTMWNTKNTKEKYVESKLCLFSCSFFPLNFLSPWLPIFLPFLHNFFLSIFIKSVFAVHSSCACISMSCTYCVRKGAIANKVFHFSTNHRRGSLREERQKWEKVFVFLLPLLCFNLFIENNNNDGGEGEYRNFKFTCRCWGKMRDEEIEYI